MKKFILSIAACAMLLPAFAQRSTRQVRPDAAVSFENGNAIQVVSASPSEVFFLITNKAFSATMEQETVAQSNERLAKVPGVVSFSRGGDGSCKLVLEADRVNEVLTRVIGFTEAETNRIF